MCRFLPLIFFSRVVARRINRSPLFSSFDALCDEGGGGTGFPANRFAALLMLFGRQQLHGKVIGDFLDTLPLSRG